MSFGDIGSIIKLQDLLMIIKQKNNKISC